MLYAVTAAQMRAMEAQAFEKGVSSLLLMERAASCAMDALEAMIGSAAGKRLLFVCGPGNNGGDGLAAARIWHQRSGIAVVLMSAPPATDDARTNARFLDALGIPQIIADEAGDWPGAGCDAVVDCLFGTGLSRAPQGVPAKLIEHINTLEVPVLSVDVPSGADATTGTVYTPCVRADTTVVLHCHKIGLLTGAARAYAGEIRVSDIGIPRQHVADYAAQDGWATVAEASDLSAMLPMRSPTAHKGAAGRVLVYAGSFGMAGAAAMAAQAALNVGAGLVTIAVDESIIPVLQLLVPNATCMPIDQAVQSPPPHDVLLAGCGLSRGAGVWGNLMALYDRDKPTVLDADALNLLSGHTDFVLSPTTLITPHPGEAARLLKTNVQAVIDDLPTAARALHRKYGACVLLKSHASVAFDGTRMGVNAVAAPALAKGGSGDMLAGMLAGILAQGKPKPDLFQAAQAASLWMSLAANEVAGTLGDQSVLSGDVIRNLGPVLASLRRLHPPHGTQQRAPAGS